MRHTNKKLRPLCMIMAVTTMLFSFAMGAYAAPGDKTDSDQTEGYVKSVYTGENISAQEARYRPIAVMMPTDKVAQPCYGIGSADILYEVMEEGNISRQMAVIPGWRDLSKIGNIRSMRAYYIPVATEWDSIIVHFGGVFYMRERITKPDINNISGTNEYGTGGGAPGSGAFFRTDDRKAPHNAYTDGTRLEKAALSQGYSLTTRPEFHNEKHFTFADHTNDLSAYGDKAYEATEIDLSEVFPYTSTSFSYNSSSGLYEKSIHGEPHIDGINRRRLSFANVIVQFTKYSVLDSKGYLGFQNIDNTEDGYYFTKGRVIHVKWAKTADYSPTVFYDDNGREIELNRGKTYIALAQKGRIVSFY